MLPSGIKDMADWGSQRGLLSSAEITLLMGLVRRHGSRVLEVGHYYGLSTCAMVTALRHSGKEWSLLTVDAHISDAWVPETDPEVFFVNKREHFNDPRLQVLIQRSESIVHLDGFDFVFYDGDHADEQMRFTELVHNTPSVKTFVFDDRDFVVPEKCCHYLRTMGWTDHSPTCARVTGDKNSDDTMTLGVFTRG